MRTHLANGLGASEAAAPLRSNVAVFPIDRTASDRLRATVLLHAGELFACPSGPDVAIVESGALVLDLVMANGVAVPLRRFEPGCAVVDLAGVSTPALQPRYRAVGSTRLGWLRARTGGDRSVETELMVSEARAALLESCMRLVHQLACLQAPHRLYAELLRLADTDGKGARLALPGHADLAAQLCTSRETVSRELSFLRRTGVLSDGKTPRLLDPDFLLNSLARALGLASVGQVWRSIGVDRD